MWVSWFVLLVLVGFLVAAVVGVGAGLLVWVVFKSNPAIGAAIAVVISTMVGVLAVLLAVLPVLFDGVAATTFL